MAIIFSLRCTAIATGYQREVEGPLAQTLLSGRFADSDVTSVDVQDQRLHFSGVATT